MKKLSLLPICALCALAISAKGKTSQVSRSRGVLQNARPSSALRSFARHLQNARKMRRMAYINEAIIDRAFCKTPLLPIAAENVRRKTTVENEYIGHDRK